MSQPRVTPAAAEAAERLTGEATLARLVSGFAAGIALLLAFTVPAMHAWSTLREERAALSAEARVLAHVITQFATRNPDMWVYQDARLRALLSAGDDARSTLEVRDGTGRVIVQLPMDLAWPRLAASDTIFDSGMAVGSVRVERSMVPALAGTSLVAVLALLLAAGSYAALRLLPLRLLRQAMGRATYLATHDQLTGLPNRRLFHDRLAQIGLRTSRYGGGFAVLALDLDRFKEVNDTLGHAAGDELLRQVARALAATLRDSDTLARLGGDEFAIIQVDAQQPRSAEALAARLVERLSMPFDLNGNQALIGTSIGIALSGGPKAGAAEIDPGQLLQDADTALYSAKAEGRNGFRFFSAEMNRALQERRQVERDLRRALAEGQLRLHYQPQVDLVTQQVVGLEALLRWEHPQRGQVMPDAFIGVAEEIGLLNRIGEWVLLEACATAIRWPGPRMAVNISANHFQSADFLRAVRHALDSTGLNPRRLEIEITEGVLLTDTERTLATLGALREMGVSVAMDDFGTGYSSLGYLHKFRFDKIKIDRSFVTSLGDDPQSVAIIRAVIAITQALGLRCNAEGVESIAQAALLRAEGCTEAQGFLYGRAMPEQDLAVLLGVSRDAAA
ncbi:EAL domain-containing protein [Roseomonas frigidaquae]|uniref:EAL domain-containing protein n=1 Tax=Falsiroseomonas frigidaquae TaxID=487318 RepID=A0ABX1EYP2_9PROT|nr:EAL domain-containing protein [Falsiroseomonas frigidaquae]NKE45225.1 EAL domain-containing protein [Falsiroseomonas frigidaquae]